MRKEAYIALIGALLVWIQFGCQPTDFPITQIENPTVETELEVETNRTFLMGTFNIQTFGRAKIGKNDVTATLVDIVRRFDLIAIQELRSVEQHIIPTFLEMLNANGMNYQAEVSERLGYTHQKEQLVYIYDANKLQVTRDSFVAPDPTQAMHRSLYVTSFRCSEASPENAFTFTLLNVHVDPDEIRTEVPALNAIVQNVVEQMTEEDDFIVLGDFNIPAYGLIEFPMLTNQVVVIPEELATNTLGNKSVDNIVFDREATLEYRGNGGVIDLLSEYNLSMEQALYVSDHMPVWAEFSIFETLPSSIASPGGTEIRR